MTNTLHKWLILDKPHGMTSTKAGSLIKRLFQVKSLGHAGTLDPFATGVLPLALGESTKILPYVTNDIKEYMFEVTFGEQRDTGDLEGNVVAVSSVLPTAEQIQRALGAFRGTIVQIPPRYSALKIGGKRACDLVRQGVDVEMKPRQVTVFEFEMTDMPSPPVAQFRVVCGPGTYVRSLGSDLAISLGTVGYVSQLRRTRVGKFTLKDSVKLDILLNEAQPHVRAGALLSIRDVLDDIPALPILDNEKEIKVRHGQSLSIADFPPPLIPLKEQGMVLLLCGGSDGSEQELALAQVREGCLYPKRLFLI